MNPKFSSVYIPKSDKELLVIMSKILGKSQSKILSDYIRFIFEYVGVFERATLLLDDSNEPHSYPTTLEIKIEGVRRSEVATEDVSEGESKEAIDKVIE